MGTENGNVRGIDPNILTRERKQLLNYWGGLFTPGSRALKEKSVPLNRLRQKNGSTVMDVRKVHDRLGWQAKNPVRCAGAIYRTKTFMEVPPEERDASKPRGANRADWPRNIHIEHTVPASQLHRKWLAEGGPNEDPQLFLARYGIATAMHATEEADLGNDYHAVNPCFGKGHGRPFARYDGRLAESVIYNVLTGRPVDRARYSLSEHEETLRDILVESGAPASWVNSLGKRGINQ